MILPDILQSELKTVFCGTRVSKRSFELGEYYAGPGNKFWDILYETGLTPRLMHAQEYFKLPQYGIGLADLAKSGLDFAPRTLAFNGKRAASEFFGTRTGKLFYGLQKTKIGETSVYILPSTSGAARGPWNPEHWQELARVVREDL